MSVKSTILWGWGPVLPQPLLNPDVRPLGTYETLKINSLLLRALTTKELAGKKAACLFEEHA